MIYLLISGAPSTGKTETIYDITTDLINRLGYRVTSGTFITPKVLPPLKVADFTCIIDGINTAGTPRKVLVNSPSDLVGCINTLKHWRDTNSGIDVIITSIRDGGDPMRTYLINEMAINPAIDTVVEIPLGKITRHKPQYTTALAWYKTTMLAHITSLLRIAPLEL